MAYVVAERLKRYLGLQADEPVDNDLLEEFIAQAEGYIDQETHRHFEAVAKTRRYHVGTPRAWGDRLISAETIDNPRELILDDDLLTITTLQDQQGARTFAASDYVLLPTNESPKYAILLIDAVWEWVDTPLEAVIVTGEWGWSTTAPADIAMITRRLAAFLYRQKDSQVFDTTAVFEGGVLTIPQGVPRIVQMVINRYRKMI